MVSGDYFDLSDRKTKPTNSFFCFLLPRRRFRQGPWPPSMLMSHCPWRRFFEDPQPRETGPPGSYFRASAAGTRWWTPRVEFRARNHNTGRGSPPRMLRPCRALPNEESSTAGPVPECLKERGRGLPGGRAAGGEPRSAAIFTQLVTRPRGAAGAPGNHQLPPRPPKAGRSRC